MTTVQIDSISAAPGQKSSGYTYANVGSSHVRLPVLLVNGARPGPRLTLTAGLHYGEFIGIEALRELVRKTDPMTLTGQLIACPLACPPAFYEHCLRGSPLDGLNPNRVYPGSATGRPTERMVAWIFENLIRRSDVFIDLHGGGVTLDLASFVAYRSSTNHEQDRRALELAEVFGLPIVRGSSPGGGNSHAASTRAGIVSLLVEVGSRGSRSHEEVALVRDGLLRVMQELGMIAQAPPRAATPIQHWGWTEEVEAPIEGLWYPEFQIGDDVEAGKLLGRILDPLDNVLAEIAAPQAGRVFYGERALSIACGGTIAAMAVREDAPPKLP